MAEADFQGIDTIRESDSVGAFEAVDW